MRVWRGMILLAGILFCQASWAFCTSSVSFSISPGTVVVQRDVGGGAHQRLAGVEPGDGLSGLQL
ncbi:hypothetical protein U9Z62_03840 [Escherichia coli]|nr:hypothetical protein [Escherichia coli]